VVALLDSAAVAAFLDRDDAFHAAAAEWVRKLAGRKWRDKLTRFVAEGEDLAEAAASAGWTPVALYRADQEIAAHVLVEISQLGSGTRVLGVYPQRWHKPAAPCVALWGVADPGNVGTVLRSALAFGAATVALGPGSADPYGHKAVRASMGSIFSVPVARVKSVTELPRPVVALVAREGVPLHEVGEVGTWLVGAEREGLPAEVLAEADQVAHIPIANESLNAAMAATVALYERMRSA